MADRRSPIIDPDPWVQIEMIRRLLLDGYGPQALRRELVQNADDANAVRLEIVVLEQGLSCAHNSLLSGPALLVANDGPFPTSDRDALHQALGGSKAADPRKIGRFGVGLKSVFHLCEAFVYLGSKNGNRKTGAVNPWAGIGEEPTADPLHPDWDTVDEHDLRNLTDITKDLTPPFCDGLLLWIPFRLPDHLNRSEDDILKGLGTDCPCVDSVVSLFHQPESLALLIAQCRHLCSIKVLRASSPECITRVEPLAHVTRTDATWVGRHDGDCCRNERTFRGTIRSDENGDVTWTAHGIDAVGLDSLRDLRSRPDWPKDERPRNGRLVSFPRKALAHAAVTILYRAGEDTQKARGSCRLRWAAFLPLNDGPDGSLVETVSTRGTGTWDIVLHGYFWPSQDRRSIPWDTGHDDGAFEEHMRAKWNRTLRDELLLPLLPRALEPAVEGVSDDVAWDLIKAAANVPLVQQHLASVTRSHVLLPVLTVTGVSWKACVAGTRVLSLPSWKDAPPAVRGTFTYAVGQTPEVMYVDRDAPGIGAEPSDWTVPQIEILLNCVSSEAFGEQAQLAWVAKSVRHLLGPQPAEEESAAVARWIAKQIGEGVLEPAIEGPAETRKGLRQCWSELFSALPEKWHIHTPGGSARAVAELAIDGGVGPGLLPIPFEVRPNTLPAERPAQYLLDLALRSLGDRLNDPQGGSLRMRRSRLLLAETLIAARADPQLPPEIAQLPVLRAVRLPDVEDEAWTIDDLRRQSERRRVLDRSRYTEEAQPDHTRAATEFAEAVGEPVWLVDGPTASMVSAPPATSKEALAHALLRATVIKTAPAQRKPLLNRLARGDVPSPAARAALRILLTGSADARDECDIYVLSNDDAGRHEQRTLRVLLELRRQKWRAVDLRLADELPFALFTELRLRTVDATTLQVLLGETLQWKGTNWCELSHGDVEHLLLHLYGNTLEDRDRWQKMPLHRYVHDDRGPLDEGALRATGQPHPLPEELKREVRILDPDPIVEHLYRDQPPLNDDGILEWMLRRDRPDRYADRILDMLRSNTNGQELVNLPRDDDLLGLLRTSKWLPSADGTEGLAPEGIVVLPDPLRHAIGPLAGELMPCRLPEAAVSTIWQRGERVVRELLGRPGPVKQVERLAVALNRVGERDGGSYLILYDASDADPAMISDAIQSPLVRSHVGWRLMQVAATAVNFRTEAGTATSDAIVALAQSLSAPVPAEHQVSMLVAIAEEEPGRDSPGGRLFRRLLQSFALADTFFREVLPDIKLPTQDGRWRPATQIARSRFGVERRHRLPEDLGVEFDREGLGMAPDDQATDDEWKYRSGKTTDAVFRPYFQEWETRINRGAVGALLSIMGDGKCDHTRKLAQDWLGEDVPVASVRRDLGCEWSCAGVGVFVRGARYPGQLWAENLLGERVPMAANIDDKTVFAVKPVRDRNHGYWHVELRDIEPSTKSPHELASFLGNTAEWWAVQVLGLDRDTVRTRFSRWAKGAQKDVAPVRASILAHLPLTLRQLGTRECGSLHDAVTHSTRAQRRREQEPGSETISAERAALDDLAQRIEEPAHQRFLLDRVRKQIEQSGYQADSVLLELAQNADDALAQAAEIADETRGTVLPSDARRVVVRVHEHNGQPTVDLIHYGRPINDTGGVAFAAQHDREWDQDLYFMMLMSLSGKPGEAAEHAAAAATTGLFGLGFKSVHLVTETPTVVSGLIAFSIAGGLLPVPQDLPNDPDLASIDGHRSTRIRLPLRGDIDRSDLTEQMLCRFRVTCALLPAFAREIREIRIEGGQYATVCTFDGQQIDGAPAWSIGNDTIDLPGPGTWRLLRFLPRCSDGDTGTAALLVGLRDGIPVSFPSELPFLWHVTPTKEYWECGYAVSGPFKLDHGRTRVDLDHRTTNQVVEKLGEALGTGLVQLYDVLNQGIDPTLGLPTDEQSVSTFVTALWKVLAAGIDNRDELRRKFLLRLHGGGRGISAWMDQCPVVPTELPPPFRERLPPLHSDTRIEQAAGGLHSSDLCHAFSSIGGLRGLAQEHLAVSGHLAQLLRPLREQAIPLLFPTTLLTELVERWVNELTSARLHELRPLADDGVWRLCADDGTPQSLWYANLRAQSANGTFRPLHRLLLLCNPEHADPEIGDELLRAAFAPDEDVLDPAYATESDDVVLFRRLRGGHRIDSETMTRWFADLDSDRRRAALRYLLDGSLRGEILDGLLSDDHRPEWLEDYDCVCQTLGGNSDLWQVRSLLIALFPDRFKQEQPPPPPTPDFFARFQNWWGDERVREDVLGQYESQAWPAWLRERGIGPSLCSGSDDHWLALLVLGACRGLGRSTRKQHRHFLQLCYKEGWWEVFKDPDPSRDQGWMEVLRASQDLAIDRLDYSYWMSLFPAIYQCSRYLDVYRRVLRTAGRRPPNRIERLFTPRSDPALGGSGRNFDAPPFPFDMGRHWVMRELVRLGVVSGDHLLPDCWVPSRNLITFLRRFRLQLEDGVTNAQKAQLISQFLQPKLQVNPHLCYCFDIPFLYVAADEKLRRDFGYE